MSLTLKKMKQKTLTELLRAEERRKNKLRALISSMSYALARDNYDVGPNDSELKNVAGVVRRGSLIVVIQVGRCPVVQNRASKASCAATDVYKRTIFSFESPMP